MPEYSYRCTNPECTSGFVRTLSVTNRDIPQECPICTTIAKKIVSEGIGGVLRGDVWAGKNIHVKTEMHRRRAAVGVREQILKRDGHQFNLMPNVDGEQVDSWEDASKLAADRGKDTSAYRARARQARQKGSSS